MANSSRKNTKRELDRAVGNIEWALDKLTGVLVEFSQGAKEYEEQGKPIPETYTHILDGIDVMMQTLVSVQEGINALIEIV